MQRTVSGSVACGSSASVCLKEDPVFGTQLQNSCELRVPTAEKAAFYFDAALAARRASKRTFIRRNTRRPITVREVGMVVCNVLWETCRIRVRVCAFLSAETQQAVHSLS